MPNEDFVTRKTDAEIRRINNTIASINSIIAARKTDINISKNHLKRHPPLDIEVDIRHILKI